MSSPHRLLSAPSLARAVAELVLIVAGILIALFLDSWWEDRGEAEQERVALAQIRQNLLEDSVDLSNGILTYEGYVVVGRWIDAHLGRDVPTDSAERALAHSIPIHIYQPQQAGYVGLRDSGRLDLIRNDSLRADLIRYFEQSQQEIDDVTDWMAELRNDVRDVSYAFWTIGPWPYSPDARTATARFPIRLLRPWADVPADPELRSRWVELAEVAANMATDLYPPIFAQNAHLRERITRELEGS